MKLIVNRAPGGVVDAGVMEEIDRFGLDLIGALPQDETVYRFDCDGKPTSKIPADSPARLALEEIVKKLELKK